MRTRTRWRPRAAALAAFAGVAVLLTIAWPVARSKPDRVTASTVAQSLAREVSGPGVPDADCTAAGSARWQCQISDGSSNPAYYTVTMTSGRCWSARPDRYADIAPAIHGCLH